jgi:acyl CoA:acetate/3-ketoacid CoA transferase beta subunit
LTEQRVAQRLVTEHGVIDIVYAKMRLSTLARELRLGDFLAATDAPVYVH